MSEPNSPEELQLAALLVALGQNALTKLREGGIVLDIESDLLTSAPPVQRRLLAGAAQAAKVQLELKGTNVTNALVFAVSALEAIAALSIAVQDAVEQATRSSVSLSSIILAAIEVGRSQASMVLHDRGWIDDLATYDRERERKRAGAIETNAQKQGRRRQALDLAVSIVGKNATLSHEEVAIKLHALLGGRPTVRTVTGWVQNWRRTGELGPKT